MRSVVSEIKRAITGVLLFNRPGRREAADFHLPSFMSIMTTSTMIVNAQTSRIYSVAIIVPPPVTLA